jgi:hypothetical protein
MAPERVIQAVRLYVCRDLAQSEEGAAYPTAERVHFCARCVSC